MSRSNHIDWLCDDANSRYRFYGEIGEDGFCEFHRPQEGNYRSNRKKCKGPRQWMSRRGIVTRKARMKDNLYSSCPKAYRKMLWSQVRARYKQDIAKYGEVLEDHNKWMSGRIGCYW